MPVNSEKISPLNFSRWTIATACIIGILVLNRAEVADAKKKFRRDDLPLKRKSEEEEFPVQVLKRGFDNINNHNNATGGTESLMIRDVNGKEYDLSRLEPFIGLFSESSFTPSSDNTMIQDKRTREWIKVSIFRAVYEDGSTVLVEKDEHDNIEYVEVRRPASDADTFFVPNLVGDQELLDGEGAAEFLSFTNDDIDYELLQSRYHYGEASRPDEDRDPNRELTLEASSAAESPFPHLDYRQGRVEFTTSSFSSFGFCSSYKVVNVGVVYDGDFCNIYGGFEDARRRIMTIVASASFHYERDMCVQLKLTDIATPDGACSPRSSFFQDYNREVACGSDTSFLTQFSSLMRDVRDGLDFNLDSTVHMFTGYDPPGGTIGCAFVGSFCHNDYTYGVEYMSFSTNPYSQGVVLAHEIGHILNAPHLEIPPLFNHIMEANINNAAGGFNRWSIVRILSFLNSAGVVCEGTADIIGSPHPTALPSSQPTSFPTPLPSSMPSSHPSSNPTASPTRHVRTAAPRFDDGNCRLSPSQERARPCIFTSTGSSRYACFDAASLLGTQASNSCSFRPPLIRILRCAGPLRSGFVLGSSRGIRTRSCSASCVVTGNSLCFRAGADEQVYSVSFYSIADFDVIKSFTKEVAVRHDDGTGTCATAAMPCITL